MFPAVGVWKLHVLQSQCMVCVPQIIWVGDAFYEMLMCKLVRCDLLCLPPPTTNKQLSVGISHSLYLPTTDHEQPASVAAARLEGHWQWDDLMINWMQTTTWTQLVKRTVVHLPVLVPKRDRSASVEVLVVLDSHILCQHVYVYRPESYGWNWSWICPHEKKRRYTCIDVGTRLRW